MSLLSNFISFLCRHYAYLLTVLVNQPYLFVSYFLIDLQLFVNKYAPPKNYEKIKAGKLTRSFTL
jgi:hypothetical protein